MTTIHSLHSLQEREGDRVDGKDELTNVAASQVVPATPHAMATLYISVYKTRHFLKHRFIVASIHVFGQIVVILECVS